ncbi:MAG: flippase-like domain-containing protein [Bradymonadaceae bacterium]|nr:flippase-like domain-containing protein [Lujinxingiaceae bacterium]
MVRFLVYFLIANVIGGFFLWLSARALPFDEVSAYVQAADLGHLALWSALFIVIYIVCHGARVARWYYLVQPLGDVAPGRVHRVCAVGFAAILLLPLRLGELVRPYLLARQTGLPMAGVLATAVVERVIDGLLITGLLFVTLATYSGDRATGFALSAGLVSAAIFVPALSMCMIAYWRRAWASALLTHTIGRVWPALAAKLGGMLDAFIGGFKALVQGRAMGRFMTLTALYWTANVVSMWMLATYCFGLEVGLWEMATVLAILVIGIMIPAGPAMAGNFEYFVAQGMALFLAIELTPIGTRVAVFAATVHILQFVVIVLPGVLLMWLDPESRHLIRLSQEAEKAARELSSEPVG